ELTADNDFDYPAIESALAERPRIVYVQRSGGYSQRTALSCEKINKLTAFVRRQSDAYVVVDNCYGEFTETAEPTADLLIGSLIKNPGGGMAESGGYLCGREELVALCAERLTAPGVGGEIGATLGQNKALFRGLFYAPHSTAQAMKTAVFAAYLFDKLGFDTAPRYNDARHDIVQQVHLGNADRLLAFCRGLQAASPIDSHVTPIPWDMPGYDHQVVMAAGAFVSGASIELSADAPMREPYTVFLQGGLTFESGKLGIISAAKAVLGQ
ncbi:MAG: methionine gamma-lyase family protein, partial [Oscillospiraceae bacterium]|nr:methionine gamma-lyase family protein [Oscillospiraceae bacterium]